MKAYYKYLIRIIVLINQSFSYLSVIDSVTIPAVNHRPQTNVCCHRDIEAVDVRIKSTVIQILPQKMVTESVSVVIDRVPTASRDEQVVAHKGPGIKIVSFLVV